MKKYYLREVVSWRKHYLGFLGKNYTIALMATQITQEELAAVAGLARLELTDEEKSAYSEQINTILGYIDIIAEVDTTGVMVTSQVTGLENVVRTDDLVGSRTYNSSDAMDNAPSRSGTRFRVPQILPTNEE